MKQPPDSLISCREVSALIGLSVKTIYAGKCGTDDLLRIPAGERRVLFSRNNVLDWIARRRREAAAALEPEPVKFRMVRTVRFTRRKVVASLADWKAKRPA